MYSYIVLLGTHNTFTNIVQVHVLVPLILFYNLYSMFRNYQIFWSADQQSLKSFAATFKGTVSHGVESHRVLSFWYKKNYSTVDGHESFWENMLREKICCCFFWQSTVFLQKNFQVIKIFMKSMMQPEHLVQDYSLHSTKLFNNMFYCNL